MSQGAQSVMGFNTRGGVHPPASDLFCSGLLSIPRCAAGGRILCYHVSSEDLCYIPEIIDRRPSVRDLKIICCPAGGKMVK